MSFGGPQAYMGWKSTKVFFRRYAKHRYDIYRFVAAAGNVVNPAS